MTERLRAAIATDDAPLWAEVAAVMLAGALVVRAGAHAWVAVLASAHTQTDVAPTIARDHDLSLKSPVMALRGHRVEPVARGATTLLGFGGLDLHAGAAVATTPVELLATAWLTLQFAALAADPVALLLDRIINQQQ
jgi:hypothetical protein